MMPLKKAREINTTVARWYMDTIIFEKEAVLPSYTREEMIEAFRVVDRANNLQLVTKSGKRTITCVCDARIADMVISFREEARRWLR